MASRVGWLVEHFMQASVWRIVWVLPLAHMLLFIAMMPEDYHTILVNRVQPLGAIILLFLLGLMAFLIELFYRIARSITDGAALREENHFPGGAGEPVRGAERLYSGDAQAAARFPPAPAGAGRAGGQGRRGGADGVPEGGGRRGAGGESGSSSPIRR